MPVERRTQIGSRSWSSPEGFTPVERHTQKGSQSCEEQVGKGIKGISHLA
jgi:hypothetical protein